MNETDFFIEGLGDTSGDAVDDEPVVDTSGESRVGDTTGVSSDDSSDDTGDNFGDTGGSLKF